MRKLLRKIIEILDGTPSVYGERQQGQSVLEMVFITPLLIILIVGVVEIGWLANNYLILQEVSKVGARRATVLPSDLGPISWDLNSSLRDAVLLPAQYTDSQSIEPGQSTADPSQFARRERDRLFIRFECNESVLQAQTSLASGGTGGLQRSFYNELFCVMLDSFDPLSLDRQNGIDDLIISVFAVQTLHNDPAGDYDFENGYTPSVDVNEHDPGYTPVVVGRYPRLANECNMRGNPDEDVVADATRGGDIERDPFDYINDNLLTYSSGADAVPIELAFFTDGGWTSQGYDDGPEFQRGFSLYGNHMVDPIEVTNSSGTTTTYNVFCYGSNWSIQDIQDQISVPEFEFTAAEASDPRVGNDDTGFYLPSQGVVLVEIYWQHRLLLNLPVFSPVMQALGDDRTTLYVWSIFPVPTAEPNITFP